MAPEPAPPREDLVRLPGGVARVRLDRHGLGLGDRGGFDAAWLEPSLPREGALTGEAWRLAARAHLAAVHRSEEGGEAGAAILNLASWTLLEDLRGWAALNADEAPGG